VGVYFVQGVDDRVGVVSMDVYLQLNEWLQRIETWQDDPKGGYDGAIEVLGSIQDEIMQIQRIRHEVAVLGKERE
jgi:hypothetical protein